MSTNRTIADVEAEIASVNKDIGTVKKYNPNWKTISGDKALITSYYNRLTLLSQELQALRGRAFQSMLLTFIYIFLFMFLFA
jgi:hypothetical protein